jgi:hypothetical protein
MVALNKLSRRLLVYAGESYGERSRQHKPTGVVAAEANLGDNFDVAIGKMAASLGAHLKERILKTGSIASGEELLWAGCIALASERLGQGQLKIEQAVIAADRPVTDF